MTRRRFGEDVLTAISRVAEVIESEAAPSEAAQRATPGLVEALHSERLFRLWIPASIDGDELDLPASLRAFEAVSRLDGSAGWTVMIGVGGGIFAAYLGETAAREIFGPTEALIAGSGSPRGSAAVEPGGFRAEGHWIYASGAHQATTFTANCFVQERGEPVLDVDGRPLIRAMSFPASEVEIVPNWDVLGMRGTGSHDFRVGPTYVPRERTFSVFTDEPREPGPLYRFPFGSIAQLAFGPVALGIARHALALFSAMAAEKPLYGSDRPLASNVQVRTTMADARATLDSARAWFYAVALEAWETVAAGLPLDEAACETVRLASVHAAVASARAADLVVGLARTSIIRDGDALGRAWRDVHVVRQHAALSPVVA